MAELREVLTGIHAWSVFAEDRGFHFNGFALATDAGTVAVDPVDPAAADVPWDRFDALAPFEGVYVTNRNHSRASAAFRERYGAPVKIHEADAERAEVDADEILRGGEVVGGRVTLVPVPGKSPGELAFFLPESRALVVGDLVVGGADGELVTYPEKVIDDVGQLRRSAERLLELDFDELLLCDGEVPVPGGKAALRRFVEAAR